MGLDNFEEYPAADRPPSRSIAMLWIAALVGALIGAGVADASERGEPTVSTAYALLRSGQTLRSNLSGREACDEALKAQRALDAPTRTSGSVRYVCREDRATVVSYGPNPVTPSEPQQPAGTATLTWTPPTRNTDGSELSNLAGYRISYGTRPDALTQTVQIPSGNARYAITGLVPGTYYFAVRAYRTDGTESANSNVESKVIR